MHARNQSLIISRAAAATAAAAGLKIISKSLVTDAVPNSVSDDGVV